MSFHGSPLPDPTNLHPTISFIIFYSPLLVKVKDGGILGARLITSPLAYKTFIHSSSWTAPKVLIWYSSQEAFHKGEQIYFTYLSTIQPQPIFNYQHCSTSYNAGISQCLSITRSHQPPRLISRKGSLFAAGFSSSSLHGSTEARELLK